MTGTWRSHQVPLSGVKNNPEHLLILQEWLESYKPEELFDADGKPVELVLAANPEGDLRMSAITARQRWTADHATWTCPTSGTSPSS